MISNPSLQAQPRDQVSPTIWPNGDVSIFNWLEQTGRFIQRDDSDFDWSEDDDLLLEPLMLASDEEDE